MLLWIEPCDYPEQSITLDEEHLESLGVIVGEWDSSRGNLSGQFINCEVDDETLNRLNPYFGELYIWGPMP